MGQRIGNRLTQDSHIRVQGRGRAVVPRGPRMQPRNAHRGGPR